MSNAARGKHHQLGAITLIELLLVMAILALLGGVISLNVRGAMSEQRFYGDVQRVVDHLRMAQDLMLLVPAEMEVKFKDHALEVTSEDKLSQVLERAVGKRISLEHIRSVIFEDAAYPILYFMSDGFVTPKGTLTITGLNGEKRYILFSGAPQPIRAVSTVPGQASSKQWNHLIEVTRDEIQKT